MTTTRRLGLALLAVALGFSVTIGLLLYEGRLASGSQVLVLTRDVPAGGEIAPEALGRVTVRLPPAQAAAAVAASSLPAGSRSTHDLAAGQVLQRPDLVPAGRAEDRTVLVPVREMPPVRAGDRVDLLLVSGTADRPSVTVFAAGVEVRTPVTGGLVVSVPARQASAFVYAASAMRLAAVVAAAGARAGEEPPVSGPDQALALVRR